MIDNLAGKKLKILLVHNYYQFPGGEDTVVANEKKLLEDHGHEVVLYSRNNSELKKMNILQKLLFPLTTLFSLKTYKEVKKIIKSECVEIVHVHNTLSLVSPSVYYAAFTYKVPVVQTIHNFRLLCPGATFYCNGHICEECVDHGLKCAVKHRCYRGSKTQTIACVINTSIHRFFGTYRKLNYICLTDFTKEKLKSLVPDNHIYVKPNFTFDAGGQSDPKDYYVFIGRLEEIKGIDVLIDAFRMMPDKKLKVVGTGVLDEKIKARVKAEQLSNIVLLGYRQREEIDVLLKHAKALIMCSQWYETFGMVIVEAYSNGTPAIVGDIGNIGDIVIEGKTGVKFQYDSAKALKEAVEHFEATNGRELGKDAYSLFYNAYSPDANYKALMSIYGKVLLK